MQFESGTRNLIGDIKMADEVLDKNDPIWIYKNMMRGFLEVRPSGLRKKISDGIRTNRSFVSQITNPKYAIPIPAQYVYAIMDICHLSQEERKAFIEAYLNAHPGQAETMKTQSLNEHEIFTIDLSRVPDEHTREIIRQSLRNMAENLIEISERVSTIK